MDGKTLFLFVILPVGVVALLVWLSLDTWRDIKQQQLDHAAEAPAQPQKKPVTFPAPALPRSAPPRKEPGKTPEVDRLIHSGVRAENLGNWQGAYNFYSRAIQLKNSETLKHRARAMNQVMAAERLEARGKTADAIACLKAAFVYASNSQEIHRRAQRLESSLTPTAGDIAAPDSEGSIAEEATKPGGVSAKNDATKNERVRVMKKALQGLRDRGMHYACIAACASYLESAGLGSAKGFVQEQRRSAVLCVTGERKRGQPIRETKARRFAHIVLNDGRKVEGLLVEATDTWVKIELEQGDSSGRKIIPMNDVGTLKEGLRSAAAINEARAKGRFQAALSFHKAGKPFLALEKLGELLHEFKDTKFLQDRATQEGMPLAGLEGLPARSQPDVLYLTTIIVRAVETRLLRLERLCPMCNGKGRVACVSCKGKGVVAEACPRCINGTVTCMYCGGTGGRDCTRCEQTGRITCPKCGGKGTWSSRYGRVHYRCSRCGGSGRCDCTACKDGWIDCSRCKKGQRRCPTCKGKGSNHVTCPKCRGLKGARCTRCRGLGELMEEAIAQ